MEDEEMGHRDMRRATYDSTCRAHAMYCCLRPIMGLEHTFPRV